MHAISKTIELDMGHRVANHKSKCSNPHGHRYIIEATVSGEIIDKTSDSSEGMIIDFGDLKGVMMNYIHEVFDHSFTVSSSDKYLLFFEQMKSEGMKINILDFVPTAENLAYHWFYEIKSPLAAFGIQLMAIEVRETPSSVAFYLETDTDI